MFPLTITPFPPLSSYKSQILCYNNAATFGQVKVIYSQLILQELLDRAGQEYQDRKVRGARRKLTDTPVSDALNRTRITSNFQICIRRTQIFLQPFPHYSYQILFNRPNRKNIYYKCIGISGAGSASNRMQNAKYRRRCGFG